MNPSITVDCRSVSITTGHNNRVTVDLDEVDVDDLIPVVMEEISIDTIIELFNDNETILYAIGIEKCKEYFDLKGTEED